MVNCYDDLFVGDGTEYAGYRLEEQWTGNNCQSRHLAGYNERIHDSEIETGRYGVQAGLIESGAMPKFSLCENGIDWFKSHGKWQETGGIPSAGSLVFFDWNGDGISDHVGIVEKYEGGIIYTVEGNTGTNIGGNNVRGVWKHSYSVGSATILGYGII